jgi:hypothetical protein
MTLRDRERQLLDRLAAEGRVTALHSGELAAAMELVKADLLYLVRDGSGRAVITPRGRRLLAELELRPKRSTAPFRYT